ncbi:MAG: NADH-quinone oxidoreductase subunit J [Anaerolineales bacterium]
MTIQQIAFLGAAVLTLGGGITMVVAQQVFRSILWMSLSFLGVGVFYVLLGSTFMAGLQLFIYVGAISALTVIALTVTRGTMYHHRHSFKDPFMAALTALVSFGTLTYLILQVPWPTRPLTEVPADDLAFLGSALIDPGHYLLLFGVASLLLLVALTSALYLLREK